MHDGTTQRIMAGDLSGRLPSGAAATNSTVWRKTQRHAERIEALMMGLKEVSDNIAHDLKTPLNGCAIAPKRRWRNPAARPNTAPPERTIEESDGLDPDLQCLLMIARAESGRRGAIWTTLTAAKWPTAFTTLRPLAEDDGMTLRVKTVPTPFTATRIDQPGAGKSRRECDQIRQTGRGRAAAERWRGRRH